MGQGVVNTLIGLWLMFSPTIFGMNEATSNNNYIVGPLAITSSVISLWLINRNVIKTNILIGVWILISLFIFEYTKTMAFFSNGICGVCLIIFSYVVKTSRNKFGGGWRSLFQHNPLHMQEAERSNQLH